ncbi:MAG TPA: 50S ribosomal protein L24 [Solirubrobacterales bacterium]|jgi:large subunit ribosomal protein L24
MRIKTDDEVVVISGKDAGKVGRVIRTEPKKNRVYVGGVNLAKHNKRAGQRQAPSSSVGAASQDRSRQDAGIISWEAAIHVSNVMLLDPKDSKPTRISVRRDKGGKRVRFAKRSGEAI